MGRTGLLAGVIVLGALWIIFAIRALQMLVADGVNSYNLGRATAVVVIALVCFWGARKVLAKLRAT